VEAASTGAVAAGVAPEDALVLATLNPAVWHGLARHGAIAPGYRADLLVLPDLETFVPELVLKGMVGISPQMAAEIISWDGKAGRWLTAGDSALVGYRLTYEDTGLGKIKRIVIYDTPITDRRTGPMTRQVVEYDRARRALVWRPVEVVSPPEQQK